MTNAGIVVLVAEWDESSNNRWDRIFVHAKIFNKSDLDGKMNGNLLS